MRLTLFAFLLLGSSALFVGCDSNDDDDPDGGTIGVDGEATGTLTPDDPICDAPRRCDRYNLDINSDMDVIISMRSNVFDTVLYLYQGNTLIETDDDGGTGLNSRIERRLSSGSYEIRASHFNEEDDYGDYILEIN